VGAEAEAKSEDGAGSGSGTTIVAVAGSLVGEGKSSGLISSTSIGVGGSADEAENVHVMS
jgi:hypothetical protein